MLRVLTTLPLEDTLRYCCDGRVMSAFDVLEQLCKSFVVVLNFRWPINVVRIRIIAGGKVRLVPSESQSWRTVFPSGPEVSACCIHSHSLSATQEAAVDTNLQNSIVKDSAWTREEKDHLVARP